MNYSIITFGCQMNKSESERVATVMERLGYTAVEEPYTADVAILNACSIRQTAIDRIWGYARNLKERNRTGGREVTTVLTGCLLPADRKKMEGKFDLVFNIKNIKELVNFLNPNIYCEDNYFDILPKYKSKHQSFIPIMTGCDNFCTFCCVPYTRGRQTYRTIQSVVDEVKKIASFGCKEVTLLGQNVNTYKPADVLTGCNPENPFTDAFARLLWELNSIDGLDRIHFTAAHPRDMSDDVINAFALPKMPNYLHLALQSGDNEILKRMNRHYTTADYAVIIKKLRAVKPDIALGTDIIEGFPGETEEQFQHSLDFYRDIGFDIAYHAQYSPRAGTPAATFPDQISKEVKKERWKRMQALMCEITLEKNQKYLGQTVSVLVEASGEGVAEGNSREMKRVRFPAGETKVGDVVAVKITNAMTWMLEGKSQAT